jgi:hypothetical protein
MGFTGVEAELAKVRKELAKLEEEAVEDLKITTRFLMEELFARTPVFEGTTIRNYKVGINGFASGFSNAIGGEKPGPTNSMALGDEPRRPANEGAARAAMESALTFKKLVNVFINNSAPNAALVDAGQAPGGPTQVIRNPGGVSALAAQSTRNARRNWK